MGNSSDNSTARPKKTLLVLAAGMGSRYGGLKQLDRFGPTGETILDYSIYDAIRNGFNKVVFIIRESFSEDFKNFFSSKFDDLVEVHYVYQELDVLPQKQLITKDLSSREKPWGTAHAVWVAKDVIHEPFVVINADDFYGEGAFAVVSAYFDTLQGKENSDFEYALIGYDLEKTLSDHGTVNRGVCSVDGHGYLNTIEETLAIGYNDLGVISYHVDQNEFTLDAKTPVSMNFWAFGPDYFAYCEKYFLDFLNDRGDQPKAEFFIPLLIDSLIKTGQKRVKVLRCDEEWFGVTYKDDKPIVIDRLDTLIRKGVYPESLWQ